MITITISASAITVHPPELPNDPPLRVRVVDVEPEEVLRHIEVTDIIASVGAHELLRHMEVKDIKEFLAVDTPPDIAP